MYNFFQLFFPLIVGGGGGTGGTLPSARGPRRGRGYRNQGRAGLSA